MIHGRSLLLLVLMALVAASAAAQTVDDLRAVLDFEATLEGLHEALNPSPDNDAPVPDFSRFFILDGTISSITVLNRDVAEYQVRIELVKGEWEGLEHVNSYKALIEFRGPEFADVLVSRIPRNAPQTFIPRNTRVLVMAIAADVLRDPADETKEVFFLFGVDIRRVF